MALPITPIVRLGTDERGNVLWMKRDDLLPFSFGGNKARIAHEYMEDMLSQGKNHMIVYGNARSNLCRVMSNLCASRGAVCTVLCPADDDGGRAETYNLLMSRAFGAEVVPCKKTDAAFAVDAALAESARRGLKPYYIYGDRTGGGNLETPTRAYRKVWAELERQQHELRVSFDEVYLATGTGMTQAGLLCGRHDAGGGARVTGISVARDAANAEKHIRGYLHAALGAEADAVNVDITDEYALGYGLHTPDMAACVRDAMRRYGVPLDLTYTGKAFYGMQKELERRGAQGMQVLFLHTGGAPLFFDDAREVFA